MQGHRRVFGGSQQQQQRGSFDDDDKEEEEEDEFGLPFRSSATKANANQNGCNYNYRPQTKARDESFSSPIDPNFCDDNRRNDRAEKQQQNMRTAPPPPWQNWQPGEQHNKPHWESSAGPSSSRSGPDGRGGPQQRVRKQKHLPAQKSELELFNQETHVQTGELFNDMFGVDKDDEIVVTSADPEEGAFTERIQTFEEGGFTKEILMNIHLKNYQQPMPIQRAIIPLINKKRNDIIGHAQTGSGKTAAFLLPIIRELEHVVKLNPVSYMKSPLCLILSPTRELAIQLYNEACAFATKTGVSVAFSYGDIPMRDTYRMIDRGCNIFVLTPGRLRHHVEDGHINLKSLRYFVLDEGDALIKEIDFEERVRQVKTHPDVPAYLRMLMFSATFSRDVQLIAEKLLKPGYFFVRVGQLNSAVDAVEQHFIEVLRCDKSKLLVDLLKKGATEKPCWGGEKRLIPSLKTLVFVEEKRQSYRVALQLEHEKFNVMSLNSDLPAKDRYKTMEDFRRGVFDVLVATDLASRGLDVPGIRHVINYDLPEREERTTTTDQYVQRIGRAGRAGNRGQATSFFDPGNTANLAKVNDYIGCLTAKDREVPEFLRKYARMCEPDPGQLYSEGRQRGEAQDTWGEAWNGQREEENVPNDWGEQPWQNGHGMAREGRDEVPRNVNGQVGRTQPPSMPNSHRNWDQQKSNAPNSAQANNSNFTRHQDMNGTAEWNGTREGRREPQMPRMAGTQQQRFVRKASSSTLTVDTDTNASRYGDCW